MTDDRHRGVYGKYDVKRTDGSSERGGKHDGCSYFVLDIRHDEFAAAALRAYADACSERYPYLAADLYGVLEWHTRDAANEALGDLIGKER